METPPPGVFHLLDPAGESNHHLVPIAPLTQPSNHLDYTTPLTPHSTTESSLSSIAVGLIRFKQEEMDSKVVVVISERW